MSITALIQKSQRGEPLSVEDICMLLEHSRALAAFVHDETVRSLANLEGQPVQMQHRSVFLQNVHHAYAQTDGSFAWPNSREGDLLKQAHREISGLLNRTTDASAQ